IEYIAKILPDGHLPLDPSLAKHFKRGEKIKVRLSKITEDRFKSQLSEQAQKLLVLLEGAPTRGGFGGREVTRAFIHER
ncbi:MAG: hypothetical protein KKF00_07475, partial [Proteobacteria bacterium]|nr:hypothetical protein [Pseudomonadota bacterium]